MKSELRKKLGVKKDEALGVRVTSLTVSRETHRAEKISRYFAFKQLKHSQTKND